MRRRLSDTPSPVLEETKKNMEITPYTKTDRTIVYLIFVFVLLNCAILILTLPWGDIL